MLSAREWHRLGSDCSIGLVIAIFDVIMGEVDVQCQRRAHR